VPFCRLAFPPLGRSSDGTSGRECARERSELCSAKSRSLEAAACCGGKIGVSRATYRGWEANRTRLDLRNIPAAIGLNASGNVLAVVEGQAMLRHAA